MLGALVWFGVAIVPCHAAADPATEHPHEMPADPGDCDHCPPAPTTTPDHCDALAAGDCRDAGPPAVESRVDDPQPALGPPRAEPIASRSRPLLVPPVAHARDGPLPGTSLQQRFCRYLI
jgi:hypothetical protein